MENGILVLDIGVFIDGGRIKILEISLEDTVFFFGVLVVVFYRLCEFKWGKLDLIDEDGLLDKFISVIFDVVLDVDVGLIGKIVFDLFREWSFVEVKVLWEDLVRFLVGELVIVLFY